MMWGVGPPSTACRRRGAGHVIATFGPPWCECPSRTNICLSLPRDNRHQCECRQLRDRGAVCAAVAAVRVEGRTNPFRVCDRLMRGKANPRPVYEISEAELRDIIQRERSGSASDAGEPFAEVDTKDHQEPRKPCFRGFFVWRKEFDLKRGRISRPVSSDGARAGRLPPQTDWQQPCTARRARTALLPRHDPRRTSVTASRRHPPALALRRLSRQLGG